MNYSGLKWPIVVILSAMAAGFLVVSDADGPIRPIVTLWFLLLCPGMAFVRLLRLKEGFYEIVLAVTLSVCLDLLVAGAMLYAGYWSTARILAILISLCSVGVLCQLFFWFRDEQRLPAHSRE
jgi:hypothetical protein